VELYATRNQRNVMVITRWSNAARARRDYPRDDEVLALGDLVAAAFVFRSNRLAGLFIDELLA
jgi:hypothetical protein